MPQNDLKDEVTSTGTSAAKDMCCLCYLRGERESPRSPPFRSRFSPMPPPAPRASTLTDSDPAGWRTSPNMPISPSALGPTYASANTFAMMEITVVVATLVQQFQVELAPGQEHLVPELKVSLRPKGGVWIKPVARRPAAAAGTPA